MNDNMKDFIMQVFRNELEEYNSFDISIYDSWTKHTESVSYEQYYNFVRRDKFCYREKKEGNYCIGVVENTNQDMCVVIDPMMDDLGAYNMKIHYIHIPEHEYSANFSESIYTKIYSEESGYFMQSTIEDMVLTLEENNMIFNFMNQLNTLSELRIAQYLNQTVIL